MTAVEKILQTEYSEKFDEIRKARLGFYPFKADYNLSFDEIRKNMMTMSFYKYGPLIENYKQEKCLNAFGNLTKRIGKYLDTGNTEYLADIANYAMIEYMFPHCPKEYSMQLHSDEYKSNLVVVQYLVSKALEYLNTSNNEFLADIANCAMIEYITPQHPKAFYKPTDNPQCDIVGFGVNEVKHFAS